MQKISNQAQAYEIEGENKENWLDVLPTKEVIKFANENIDDDNVGLMTMARYYSGQTMHTESFSLLQNGKAVYNFLPYYAGKSNKEGFELTDLVKEWIMLVGDFNKDRVIDGKTYYETVVEILKTIYGQEVEEVQEFIESLELINSL